MTSCTDDNDWSVDASYDRLFHSIEFSVTPLDDRAEVSFKKMPNTDYYIVEYSTDSLSNDIPMGGTEHSVVDSSFVDTPDSIYNLDGNTEYYIRIKGRSYSGKSSNWKYLDNFKFKTKAEQIITGVDVTSTLLPSASLPARPSMLFTITRVQKILPRLTSLPRM